MASVAFNGVAIYLQALSPKPLPPPLRLHAIAFPALAIGFACVGSVLYRFLTTREKLQAILQIKRTAQEEFERLPAQQQTDRNRHHLQSLSDAELRLNRVPPAILSASIVRWATFEAIAILGTVLGMNRQSLWEFLPYAASALALQMMTPPRINEALVEAVALLPPDARLEPWSDDATK